MSEHQNDEIEYGEQRMMSSLPSMDSVPNPNLGNVTHTPQTLDNLRESPMESSTAPDTSVMHSSSQQQKSTNEQKGGTGSGSRQVPMEVKAPDMVSTNFLPEIIKTFRAEVKNQPGYKSFNEWSLKRHAEKVLNRRITDFRLGMPSVQPGAKPDYYAVSSDSDKGDNCLMILDAGAYNATKSPIAGIFETNEFVTSTLWVTDTLVLIGTGSGNFRFVEVKPADGDDKKVEFKEQARYQTHSDVIRHADFNKKRPEWVISADEGNKPTLNITNFQQQASEPYLTTTLDGPIGSVSWPTMNCSICPSVTLLNGDVLVYDIRQGLKKAAVTYRSKKKNPLTHSRYHDHMCLVGYEDGEMQHIDLRRVHQKTHPVVNSLTDPYVEGIGDIVYHSKAQSFVVSGYTDFTVWTNDLSEREDGSVRQIAKVWCHSIDDPDIKNINHGGYSTSATWLDADTIIVSSSAGAITVYVLGMT